MELITSVKFTYEEQENLLFAIRFTLEHMDGENGRLEERRMVLEQMYDQMSEVLNRPEWERDVMSLVKKNLQNVSSRFFLMYSAV